MLLPSAMMWIVFGAASAYMANKQGKNPYLWFFLGMFFGIFGLLYLFFSPKARTKRGEAKQKTPQNDPNTIDVTPKIAPEHQDKIWYYLDPDNTQHGPLSFDALSRAWRAGKVSKKTFVWNETLDKWVYFSEILQTN